MRSALVIGGGLAGLAAAARLATTGHRVTVLESRQRLGGRAGSFTDPHSGQLVDACQHVSMGCCTEFARCLQGVRNEDGMLGCRRGPYRFAQIRIGAENRDGNAGRCRGRRFCTAADTVLMTQPRVEFGSIHARNP